MADIVHILFDRYCSVCAKKFSCQKNCDIYNREYDKEYYKRSKLNKDKNRIDSIVMIESYDRLKKYADNRDKKLSELKCGIYNFDKYKYDESVNSILKYEYNDVVRKILVVDIMNKKYKPNDTIRRITIDCCVYIYITNLGKRYIGKSVNVGNRLKSHMANTKDYDPIRSVILLVLEDQKYIGELEKRMITDLRPELNTVYTI